MRRQDFTLFATIPYIVIISECTAQNLFSSWPLIDLNRLLFPYNNNNYYYEPNYYSPPQQYYYYAPSYEQTSPEQLLLPSISDYKNEQKKLIEKQYDLKVQKAWELFLKTNADNLRTASQKKQKNVKNEEEKKKSTSRSKKRQKKLKVRILKKTTTTITPESEFESFLFTAPEVDSTPRPKPLKIIRRPTKVELSAKKATKIIGLEASRKSTEISEMCTLNSEVRFDACYYKKMQRFMEILAKMLFPSLPPFLGVT